MTEREWLVSDDPLAMVRAVELWRAMRYDNVSQTFVVSDRKLRLFACACVEWRNSWPEWHGRLHDTPGNLTSAGEALLAAGAKVGQVAPGRLTPEAKKYRAGLLRCIAGNPWRKVRCRQTLNPLGSDLPRYASIREAPSCDCAWLIPTVLSLAHAAYRPCPRCVTWGIDTLHDGRTGRTDHVICPDCHGEGHVEEGRLDPAGLAVLADALEEAGCPQEVECETCHGERDPSCPACETGVVQHPLLRHLRSPGPHVMGCWAVDLILGKE